MNNQFWVLAKSHARDVLAEAAKANSAADRLFDLERYRFEVSNAGKYCREMKELDLQIARTQKDLDASYRTIQDRLSQIYAADDKSVVQSVGDDTV